ncbi:MAG: hybrid sensor histidine kinase/response regulator [Ignavibacteriales bacterium]|nr:hybrid sensor histidine kinase/response regulator [Ignavibacteriales bacterium]
MTQKTTDEQSTVLAVDDTEDNLDLLEFALKRKPIRLLRATSGQECLTLALAEQPDVILLDIQMPGMDGFETLKHLRARRETAMIPVIVLTAQKKDPQSIEKGLLLGADEYLMKPIDTDELIVRLRTLVRLRKAEAELEKTKSEFMAMLVHDLRSPMTSIRGLLEFVHEAVLEQRPLTSDYAALLSSAHTSTSKTIELINDLLDFSRYGAGQIMLDRRPSSVSSMVNFVLSQFQLQFRNKSVAVSVEGTDALPSANVDPDKVSQVVMNLVSNAYKFTNTGGTMTIKATEVMVNDVPMIEVAVANTGVGIPAEEIGNVFIVYKQTSSARTTKEKGTGLGLAICKMIIEAHGGTINVESVPGATTTFRFTIPVYQ